MKQAEELLVELGFYQSGGYDPELEKEYVAKTVLLSRALSEAHQEGVAHGEGRKGAVQDFGEAEVTWRLSAHRAGLIFQVLALVKRLLRYAAEGDDRGAEVMVVLAELLTEMEECKKR